MQYLVLMYGDERALRSVSGRPVTQHPRSSRTRSKRAASIWPPTHSTRRPWPPRSACATANGLSRMVRSRRRASNSAGYFLIDAQHLDAAINIAARIPMARKGTVEIRPVLDIPGLPTDERA